MITHTVFFTLNYPKGSLEEQRFFDAVRELARIPGTQHFTILKQISAKNNFDYGLSMDFASQDVYDQYSDHADHTHFVEKYWISGVADFIEIDYQPL